MVKKKEQKISFKQIRLSKTFNPKGIKYISIKQNAFKLTKSKH